MDEGVDFDQELKSALRGIPNFPGGSIMKSTLKELDENNKKNIYGAFDEVVQAPSSTPMNTFADDEDD